MKRQVSEAFWVIGGQAATALGTVVGVRVLTQFLKPSAYGVVTLALGFSVLAIGLVATPLTQAAIHFYPSVVSTASEQTLLKSLLRCFRTMAPWVVGVAVLAGSAYVFLWHGSPLLVLLLAALLACDCWRWANLSLLNAARNQRRYALWTTADMWSRPLAATAAVLFFGQSPIAVLGAYVIVSAVLSIAFAPRVRSVGVETPAIAEPAARELDARMWAYALPLLPLGLIAWGSSLGDRYVIGAVLSVADAGLYAAVYGLASAPFTIVGGTAEQALRPIYQTAVSSGQTARARRILTLWVLAVTGVCAFGLILFTFGHQLIAHFMVGKPYRQASALMPWIGLGYTIRAISYVFERVCYAYGKTHRVLIIQLCGVAATAVATPVGVLTLGLKGAALAVPAYFSVQLAAAVLLAARTIREGMFARSSAPLARAALSGV
jgi:O-antigen/teichoic acid export membrane protein